MHASFQPQTAPRDCPAEGKTRRPRAKPTHLLNDRCRSHSRRNRRPLQPMGQMNRHDLLPLSQRVRIFSPEAQNRSSCTPPPPCWSSPTFQSPDYRPDNGIRRSACPFPLLFHPHHQRLTAILLHRDVRLPGRNQLIRMGRERHKTLVHTSNHEIDRSLTHLANDHLIRWYEHTTLRCGGQRGAMAKRVLASAPEVPYDGLNRRHKGLHT